MTIARALVIRTTRLVRRANKAFILLRTSLYRKALLRGVGAAIEHEPVLRTLQVNTVVDVGANCGQFSLVARRVFPSAKILAFEPLSKPATVYRSLFEKDENSTLGEFALGDTENSVIIHVSKREDSSSLLPISTRQSEIFPGTEEDREESVNVHTGDGALASTPLIGPVLLKIDVQGYELAVLNGLQSTIRDIEYVYVEMSFVELYSGQALAHEVISWLQAQGYRLHGVYNPTISGGISIQTDALFRRA